MDINFNVAFAEDGQKSEINENTWKLGWVEIVGGINGVPTAQQFNQFGYIFDKKANIAYAKATEASKGLDDKADKTSVDAALAEKANSADVEEALKRKSDTDHTHDDRYYTESETDALLNGKAATNHSHSNVTTSAPGFMSAADKSKLDGVAAGANAYTHPSYTARTGVPTANQTPAFGGSFTVTQPVSDATGHITAMNSRTVTIPSTAASASAAGLVSTGAQTFAGNKTFNGQILPAGATAYGTPQARKLSSGTAAATTTNCPSGAWYGRHS